MAIFVISNIIQQITKNVIYPKYFWIALGLFQYQTSIIFHLKLNKKTMDAATTVGHNTTFSKIKCNLNIQLLQLVKSNDPDKNNIRSHRGLCSFNPKGALPFHSVLYVNNKQ